jgi:Na+/melibiose symporter-like transporter
MSGDAQKVSLSRLLAYGFPGLPLAALMLPLYVYLPAYYAEDLGLGFKAVGAVLLIARLSDVFTDPLIGTLSDRIATRFGRRRVWMVAGAPVVLLSAHMLFAAKTGVGVGYLLAWTVAAYLGVTMILLPYSAWGAEMSTDYDQRSRIAGSREGFGVIGTLLAAGLPSLLGADRGAALQLIGWMLWLLLPLSLVVALRAVPEGPAIWRASSGWRRGAAILWRNRPFLRLVVAYLLNGIANGLPASLFILFVAHVIGRPEWSGPLLFVYFFCGVAAIPLWLRLSARWGKHRVWSGAMLWAAAVFLCVPLLGPGDQWWFLLICILTGVSLGADLVLPASMQADVVDLDTLHSGRQRTGIYFAIWGMATKLALALAVGIAFPLLDLAGFAPGAAGNGDTGLFALAALYSLVPAAFKIAAVTLFWGYPITAERQRRIRAMIRSRAVST